MPCQRPRQWTGKAAGYTHLVIWILEGCCPLGGEADDGVPVPIAEGRLQLHVNAAPERRPAIPV